MIFNIGVVQSKVKTCKCFLKFNNNNSFKNHNHLQFSEQIINRQKLNNNLKRKTINDIFTRPSKFIHSELKNADVESFTKQDVQLIKINLHNARASILPKLLATFLEFHYIIDKMEFKTNKNENFLLKQMRQGGQSGALAPPPQKTDQPLRQSPPSLKNMYDRYSVKYQYLAYIKYLSQLNKLRNKLNLLFVSKRNIIIHSQSHKELIIFVYHVIIMNIVVEGTKKIFDIILKTFLTIQKFTLRAYNIKPFVEKILAHVKKIFAPLYLPWKKILVPCLKSVMRFGYYICKWYIQKLPKVIPSLIYCSLCNKSVLCSTRLYFITFEDYISAKKMTYNLILLGCMPIFKRQFTMLQDMCGLLLNPSFKILMVALLNSIINIYESWENSPKIKIRNYDISYSYRFSNCAPLGLRAQFKIKA
ncbi:hypothetical protein AGLY_008740 [Aphis glycines]|uniref:Uncharacterized protein n=1 Tax=Aphis glycines TaxID=307491 RepID=A0A6G0TKQ3_APHGL|nr:hypothetical protein AGLY_008740 [Aphis glycines]